MTTHEFLSIYDAKIAEYALAVVYLVLFVPMWRFVVGAPEAADEKQVVYKLSKKPRSLLQLIHLRHHNR